MAADQRGRRGVVLAEIVRLVLTQGLPAPNEIRFAYSGEHLTLAFGSSDELDAWARHLGVTPRVYVDAEGGVCRSWQYRAERLEPWHGYQVDLTVVHLIPAGDELVVGGPAAGQDGGAR